MNRAILIVICDFLVSAMLSMMTGMVPAHTGGTGVGLDERTTRVLLGELELRQRELENLRRQLREAAARKSSSPENDEALRKITEEMIDNMRRIEAVKRAERATAANTGVLSPAELQKKLEEEARKRLELEIRMRDLKLDSRSAAERLSMTQGMLARERDMLARERQRLASAEKRLAETTEAERSANAEVRKLAAEYRSIQQRLGETENRKNLTEKELADARRAVAAKEADLAGVKNALREMNSRIGKVSLERQELQRTLAFTSGKLNTAERDNADYRGQLAKLRREAARHKYELAEARQARQQMETLVKRSLNDLSRAQIEAERSKSAAQLAQGKLAATEKILKEVTAKPAAEAFKRYSAAAFKLSFRIREKGIMLERRVQGNYVPVLVKFGRRTLAVMPFALITGDPEVSLLYRNITELVYQFESPADKASRVLTEPLAAVRTPDGTEVAAVFIGENALPGRKPLPLATRELLLERGTDDLFLFSCRKYGRESAALGARCSIDPRSDSPYLVIRNSKQRNGGLLNAALGDIVVTREGQFVGVVTGFEKGNNPDARVLLFSDTDFWEKARRIPVTSGEGRIFADEFGAAVRAFKGIKGKQ